MSYVARSHKLAWLVQRSRNECADAELTMQRNAIKLVAYI